MLPANCNHIHTSQGILVEPGHQRRLTLSEERCFVFFLWRRVTSKIFWLSLQMKARFKVLELLNQKNYNWKHPKGVFIEEGTFSEWQVLNADSRTNQSLNSAWDKVRGQGQVLGPKLSGLQVEKFEFFSGSQISSTDDIPPGKVSFYSNLSQNKRIFVLTPKTNFLNWRWI